ncbi:MAG: choice-of-anchor B family protein [Planctomycetota bacterium]
MKHGFTFSLLIVVVFWSLAVGHDEPGGKGGGSGSGTGGGGPFASRRVSLLSNLTLSDMGNLGASNVRGNDVWGWTDQDSKREFAIFGLTNGTSFVEVTDPTAPRYLGTLQSHTGNNSSWRDMKIYNEQAYIVADFNGDHGVQVFDMTQLLDADTSDPTDPHYFSAVGNYDTITRAHNIAINEDTGFAYVVGAPQSNGGLHILDLNGGAAGSMPTYAGEFSFDGYTHDTQVVVYNGPDADHVGKEIAFSSNEDTVTIVDVTNKSNIGEDQMLSRNGYAESQYTHQGWLSEDQRHFFMNDELDEQRSDELIQTRTHVWNVEDLDSPDYLGFYEGTEATIDHNLYVVGDLIYQANYTSGMRVLKINDAQSLDIEEYAFFDTYAPDNDVTFNGAWSVFPFFESGTVLISDRQNGLFMVTVVPEPGSGLVLGVLGLTVIYRRRRN